MQASCIQFYREPDDKKLISSLLNVNELGTPWKNFEYEEHVDQQDKSVLGKLLSAILDQLM